MTWFTKTILIAAMALAALAYLSGTDTPGVNAGGDTSTVVKSSV